MKSVAIISSFGMVIRRQALTEIGIKEDFLFSQILKDFSVVAASEDIISIGPLFGEDALAELHRRLTGVGMNYIDDFYGLDFFVPDWLQLSCALSSVK